MRIPKWQRLEYYFQPSHFDFGPTAALGSLLSVALSSAWAKIHTNPHKQILQENGDTLDRDRVFIEVAPPPSCQPSA